MNTPQNQPRQPSDAAAVQILFPGGIAAVDHSTARGLLDQYQIASARDGGANAGASGPSFFANPPPLASQLRPGGVARIGWDGPMQQRPGPLLRSALGFVDTGEIARAVQDAAADPACRSIMLVVNSPGGSIAGTAELSDVITEAARKKPVVAITEDLVASAAYWAVSGCSNIYGSGPVVTAGSIGVVMVHVYAPRTDGAVITEITAGRYKRLTSSLSPLTSEGSADLQEKVDYLTREFVKVVAANRRLRVDAVAAQEGRTYIGQQAVDAGLLDGFMSVGELERQLAADPGRFMRRRAGAAPSAPAPTKASAATPAAAASRATATTWPPKLQPVVSAPVTQDAMLETADKAEEDLRAEAAEIVRMHKLTTARWPKVMTWKAWEQAGAARARQDGCTLVEGIKREGYLHPYVSTPEPHKRGAPGVKPSIVLTEKQIAERGGAWAQFKGIGVVEAFKWLGIKV